MRQKRAYQYRYYPTPSQRHTLARTFGCARFVYNWGLCLRTAAYRQRGEHLFYQDTSAALPSLKQQPETIWQSAGLLCPTATGAHVSGQSLHQFLCGASEVPPV